MKILVLDIETIRDERVWQPPAPEPPWEIQDGNLPRPPHQRPVVVVPPPRDHFAPPHAWFPIVVGFVLLDMAPGGPVTVTKIGAIEGSPGASLEERERDILEKFARGANADGGPPTMVTWNGRRFDIPALMLRSLRHGIEQPWYFGNRENRYRYSEEGHCDLADAMSDYGAAAHLGLDGMAKLIGAAGKVGDIAGKDVEAAYAAGRLNDIVSYCITDAIETAFLWLRWRLLKGFVGREEYRRDATALLEACAAQERLRPFMEKVDRKVLLLEEPTNQGDPT